MLDISIIIPVYKVEDFLPKCLDSIINQTFKNFEVILIDDGSPDGSGEICDLYKKKDCRIRVIHQQNQGSGFARNNGLDIANGEYIFFCDPDDYIEPDLLEDNLKLIKKSSANLLLFGYYSESVNRNKIEIVERAPYYNSFLKTKNEFRNQFEDLFSNYLLYTLWNKIYKKSYLIENSCKFDNMPIGEDTRFNYLVYKNLDKILLNKQIYYHYVIQRENAATKSYKKELFQIKYNEVLKLEELVEFWNYEEKCQNIIVNEWFNVLSTGIKNLFHKDCPLSDKEKKAQIKVFTNELKIKDILNKGLYSKFNDPLKIKVKKYLLSNIRYNIVYYLFKYIY